MGNAHQKCSLGSHEGEDVIFSGNANHQNTIRIGMFKEVDTWGTGKVRQSIDESLMSAANTTKTAHGSGYPIESVSQSTAAGAGFDFTFGRPVIPIEFDTNVNSKGVVDVYGLNEHWGRTGKKTVSNDFNQPLAYNSVSQTPHAIVTGPSPLVQRVLVNVQRHQPVVMESANAVHYQSAAQDVVGESAIASPILESHQQKITTRMAPAMEARKYATRVVHRAAPAYTSELAASYPGATSHASSKVQIPDQAPDRTQDITSERFALHAKPQVPVYPETVQQVGIPKNSQTNPSREIHNKVNFLNQRLEKIQNINAERKAKNEYLLGQQANSINKLEQQVNSLLEVAAKVPEQSASLNRRAPLVSKSYKVKKATCVCKDTMGNLGQVIVRNQLVRLPNGSVEQVPVKSCKVGEIAPLIPVPPEDRLDPQYFPRFTTERVPVHLIGKDGHVKNVMMPGPNPEHFLKGAETKDQYNKRYRSAALRNYAPILQRSGRPAQVRSMRMTPQNGQKSSNYRNFVSGNASRRWFRPFGK